MSSPPPTPGRSRAAAGPDGSHLPTRAETRLIVLGCVEGALDPEALFGVEAEGALVLRNTGGRVTPAVEEQLALLVGMLGARSVQVAIVHHTRCGAERFADPGMCSALHARTGVSTETLDRIAIDDPDHSLREDLERLRVSERVPRGLTVVGVRYDSLTGASDVRFTELLA